jgi:hypothetical protein
VLSPDRASQCTVELIPHRWGIMAGSIQEFVAVI